MSFSLKLILHMMLISTLTTSGQAAEKKAAGHFFSPAAFY